MDKLPHILFLAQAFCGAELALAEIKYSGLSDPKTEGRAKRAKIAVEILHTIFNEQNYEIKIRRFNHDPCQGSLYQHKDIYTLGEVYFDTISPSTIVFIYHGDIASDMTFDMSAESAKTMAGRFDQHAYDILVSEIRTALTFIE